MGNKVAVVTGAGKKLGREISLALSRNGFKVVLSYLNSEKGAVQIENIIRKEGGTAEKYRADLSIADEIKELFQFVEKKFKRLDLLINNAAIFKKAAFMDLSENIWDDIININLKSYFLCSVKAAAIMKKHKTGKIINIASIGGLRPFKNYLPYCVSKSGVIMLTQCLAKELAPDILVNSIAPGMIRFSENERDLQKIVKKERIPLKRYALPEEITEVILYLANSATYITGQTIIIDGGKILN